jgi:hypothetical protein
MATVTTKHAPPQRHFRITFAIAGDVYQVSPLPIDPSIGRKAFRFAKQTGDRATYDVRFTEHGGECECLGFLRHGHCKHVATLRAAEQVFRLA